VPEVEADWMVEGGRVGVKALRVEATGASNTFGEHMFCIYRRKSIGRMNLRQHFAILEYVLLWSEEAGTHPARA
jgi:hypothetical protein